MRDLLVVVMMFMVPWNNAFGQNNISETERACSQGVASHCMAAVKHHLAGACGSTDMDSCLSAIANGRKFEGSRLTHWNAVKEYTGKGCSLSEVKMCAIAGVAFMTEELAKGRISQKGIEYLQKACNLGESESCVMARELSGKARQLEAAIASRESRPSAQSERERKTQLLQQKTNTIAGYYICKLPDGDRYKLKLNRNGTFEHDDGQYWFSGTWQPGNDDVTITIKDGHMVFRYEIQTEQQRTYSYDGFSLKLGSQPGFRTVCRK